MGIVSLLIVAIFLWLVFNLPIDREQVPDTYEYFLKLKGERARVESSDEDR